MIVIALLKDLCGQLAWLLAVVAMSLLWFALYILLVGALGIIGICRLLLGRKP